MTTPTLTPEQIAELEYLLTRSPADGRVAPALRNAAPALLASARRLGELRETVRLSTEGAGVDVPAIQIIRNINAQLTAANARVAELEDALNRDRTELAAALGKIVDEVKGRVWIADGRGSYEWDDDRYRAEAGEGFAAVKKIAVDALARSGTIANEVLMGRTPIAQKLRDERDAATQRADAAEAKLAVVEESLRIARCKSCGGTGQTRRRLGYDLIPCEACAAAKALVAAKGAG
jgi:hypothetical protein